MENAKKMVLVEPGLLDRINQANNVNTPLSRLDSEMQKILNSKTEDREKWSLYLQTLQRYLRCVEEGRKPLMLPIITEDFLTQNDKDDQNAASYKKEEPDYKKILTHQNPIGEDRTSASVIEKPLYTTSKVLELIPKSYIKKGQLLLGSILGSNDKILWDDEGTVIIDNQIIPGSNIVDLVNDSLRPLQRSSSPIGWERFHSALKDIKVPLSYIGNKKRSNYIAKLHAEENQNLYQSTTQSDALRIPDTPKRSSETPSSTKNTQKLRSKKIDWEKWTPY